MKGVARGNEGALCLWSTQFHTLKARSAVFSVVVER